MGIGDVEAADPGGSGEPVLAAAHDHFWLVDELVTQDVGMIGDEVPKGKEYIADEGFEKIGMAEGVAVALLDHAGSRNGDGVEGEGVIEQDEEDGDAVAGGGGERFAESGGDAGLKTGGLLPGEPDPIATVAKNEPADDAEAGGGEFGEVSVEEGGAVRGFDSEGGGGRRSEVPAVVEAEVQSHLEVSAFRDSVRHVGKTMRGEE